jgi:hypothetical protein
MVPQKTVLPFIKDFYLCQVCQKVAKNAQNYITFLKAYTSPPGRKATRARNQPRMTGMSSYFHGKSIIESTVLITMESAVEATIYAELSESGVAKAPSSAVSKSFFGLGNQLSAGYGCHSGHR